MGSIFVVVWGVLFVFPTLLLLTEKDEEWGGEVYTYSGLMI